MIVFIYIFSTKIISRFKISAKLLVRCASFQNLTQNIVKISQNIWEFYFSFYFQFLNVVNLKFFDFDGRTGTNLIYKEIEIF